MDYFREYQLSEVISYIVLAHKQHLSYAMNIISYQRGHAVVPKPNDRKKARDPDAFTGIMTRMNMEGRRALRILAAERDTTLNALAVEAFNDLLRKYGKKPIVVNPLLD